MTNAQDRQFYALYKHFSGDERLEGKIDCKTAHNICKLIVDMDKAIVEEPTFADIIKEVYGCTIEEHADTFRRARRNAVD